MSRFVRSTCARTVNDHNHGSITFERGAVFPADHWAVRGIHDPNAFEDIDLDYNSEENLRRLDDVRSEIVELEKRTHGRAMHANDSTRIQNLRNRAANLQAEITENLRRRSDLAAAVGNPNATERGADTTGSSRPTTPAPGSRTRDLARSVVDAVHRSGEITSAAAENAEQLITSGPAVEQNFAARWAIATGDENYRSAFAKMAADPDKGYMLWTAEEQRAWQHVVTFQQEQRAMTVGSGPGGGYMVPLTLDPAINLTNDGTINPLRQVSRVVRTATNAWQGVTSAGMSAEWKAEAAEMADASPTLDDPSIPVHLGDVFLPYSYEVGMDAVNFLAEMQALMADAADRHMSEAYTTGSGTGQPTGIITALAGTASEVAPTTAEAFTDDDVYKVQEALPPRFRPRARWMANLSIINALDQFDTPNGGKKFPDLDRDRLLRRPILENSEMDSGFDPAATGTNHVLLFGDFSQFVIVDRIGTTMEFVPNLMGANRRPTGQRGAILWYRTGSDVLVNEAFRVLNVATTA